MTARKKPPTEDQAQTMKFVLFRLHPKTGRPDMHAMIGPGGIPMAMLSSLMMGYPVQEEGDEWKKAAPKSDGPIEYEYEYVCTVTNPKEATRFIREDPLSKYILFHGYEYEVQIPIHVMAGGRCLDTLDSEW